MITLMTLLSLKVGLSLGATLADSAGPVVLTLGLSTLIGAVTWAEVGAPGAGRLFRLKELAERAVLSLGGPR